MTSTVVKKKHIDDALGAMLGKKAPISTITEEFLHQVMLALVRGEEVHLPGFGTFRVSVRRGKRQQRVVLKKGTFKKGENAGTTTVAVEKKFYVNFRRAAAFREMFVERYGKNKVKEPK